MGGKVLLVDSDIFILLAGAGVLHEAVSLLAFDVPDLRRLDPLPYQLQRGKRFQKAYSQTVREKALEWCSKVSPVTERPRGDDLQQRLADAESIDEGETVLYGLLAEQDTCILASGDKAAMRAVACDPDLRDVRRAVAGRVICLETILKLLVGHNGPADVAKAFKEFRETHTMLRVVFSRGEATPREHCMEALRSYTEDLRNALGPGFLLEPQAESGTDG